MVTISATASDDKTQNCVTPKKKTITAATSNSITPSTAATSNSTNSETNADQMTPNILVYKKVSLFALNTCWFYFKEV